MQPREWIKLDQRLRNSHFQRLHTYEVNGRYIYKLSYGAYVSPPGGPYILTVSQEGSSEYQRFCGATLPTCFEQAKQAGIPVDQLQLSHWHIR